MDLREEFLNALKENDEVIVVFNKKNGEARNMRCTTNFNLIPSENQPSGDNKFKSENVKPVWDLEIKEWRMVNLDKIQSVSVIGE